MGERIIIDPAHIRRIDHLVTQQLKSVANKIMRSKQTAEEINRAGLIGEFAVCQYFALDPLEYVTRNGSDGGIDLVLPGSTKRIQVKYRPQPGRDLLVPNDQPLTSDVAILTEADGAPMRVRMVGFTTRENFYQNATRRRFRPNLPRDYMLPRDQLKSMRDIWGVL